jgi:polyhydroxybutyrate depolymerase
MKIQRLTLTLIILLLLPHSSFSEGSNFHGNKTGYIIKDGLKRTYLIHLPSSGFTPPLPVVFVLHGGGGNGGKMKKLTNSGFDKLADKKGFIVVYPDGFENNWNDGRSQSEAGYETFKNNTDDTGFISALIDELIKKYNADAKRVFVTGMSNGAMMSYRLACELSGKIAAIAPVAGTIPENFIKQCNPVKPVSVLAINGDADPLMPYNGGEVTGPFGKRKLGRVLSANESVMFWVKNNCCSQEPIITDLKDKDPDDGTLVQKQQFINGRSNSEVILYTIRNGGHTWPGGYQYLGKWIVGKTCRDMDATAVIWEFFEGKELVKDHSSGLPKPSEGISSSGS